MAQRIGRDERVGFAGVPRNSGCLEVLEYEVECIRIRLVFDKFWPVNIEYFDGEAKAGSELRICAQMTGCAGEANQGAVEDRLGIDALRIRRRHIGQYLDFCLDHAERLRVRAADGPPGALGNRRFTALLLPEIDYLRQQLVDMWIDGLDLRGIANELGRHLSALLQVKLACSVRSFVAGRGGVMTCIHAPRPRRSRP